MAESAGGWTGRSFSWVAELALVLAALASQLPIAQAAAQVPADVIESRVRQVYFEGFPFEEARDLAPEAVERLAAMLANPDERAHWSNIVLALGASESPLAVAPLIAFAARKPTSEADTELYQARVALPVALGHLARQNDAAFELLGSMARDSGADPGWSFQSLQGTSLGAALRRAAVTGLAVSGRPEAELVFDELSETRGVANAAEAELSRHVESARKLRRRVEREGADRVFRRDQSVRRPTP